MQNVHNVMKILSVNVGAAATMPVGGRETQSAIGKRPVSGPVRVLALGLAGDEQADLSVHGGLAKAVYAYPSEHFDFWRTVRAQARVATWETAVPPGLLGENLTLAGLTEDRLWVGDRLHLPDAVLAISEPRLPCAKFCAVMGFAQAARLMAQSGYCGSYLGVVQTGWVRAGDPVRLEPGPREVNLRELFMARMGSSGRADAARAGTGAR
jgi:MOSC domain-containing protein YiiM